MNQKDMKQKNKKQDKSEKVVKTRDEIEADIKKQYQEQKAAVDALLKEQKIEDALKASIESPPYDSESEESVQQFVYLVHSVLNRINVDKADEILAKLKRSEIRVIFDYVNKSLEYISDGKQNSEYGSKINANYLLKFLGKFYENKSRTYIIQGLGGDKSIVKRNDKWEA